MLAREVVNQSEWVFQIAPRKVRLIFYNRAPILHQADFGLFDTLDGYFKDRSERGPKLDKQVNVLAVEADHPRRFIGDLEGELLHVKRRRVFGVFCLNQDIRAKAVCHCRSPFKSRSRGARRRRQGVASVIASPKKANHSSTKALSLASA